MPGTSLQAFDPEVVESSSSSSPLVEVYLSPEFQADWDNEISFHVAEHALQLRRYRDLSQQEVANEMGTSQSAVARIESGDENITLGKLKRLANALKGRLRFAIEPRELAFPRMLHWWEAVDRGLVSKRAWKLRVTALSGTSGAKKAVAGWTTEQHITGKIIQATGAPSPVKLNESKVA